jgi:hypothetical protein
MQHDLSTGEEAVLDGPYLSVRSSPQIENMGLGPTKLLSRASVVPSGI